MLHVTVLQDDWGNTKGEEPTNLQKIRLLNSCRFIAEDAEASDRPPLCTSHLRIYSFSLLHVEFSQTEHDTERTAGFPMKHGLRVFDALEPIFTPFEFVLCVELTL